MSVLKPHDDKAHDLGDANTKWGTLHSDDVQTNGITVENNVLIKGDLTVQGDNFVATVTKVEATDPIIALAKDNSADTFDIGFYGKSVIDGSPKFHGLVRDATDEKFKVFKDAAAEPGTAVGTHSVATVVADLEVPSGSSLKVPNSAGTLVDYITAVTLGTAAASKVLTVDASKDLTGINNITASGTIQAGNVLISGNAISTSSGSAEFTSAAITGGAIDGTPIGATAPSSIVSTTFVATGNVDLGDADTDTLTITAKVDSDVLPTGTVDLGASDAKWAEAHVTTVNAVALSATGNTDLGTNASNTLTIAALVDSDIVPEADGTRSLGSSAKRWGHVHTDNITANSLTAGRVVFAGTDGQLTDDDDLSFSEATLTATNISSTTVTSTNISSGNVTITGGSIDGATIATSNITVAGGKTLNVAAGTLTTSASQKLAILQGLADNADPDLGNNTLTAEQFISDVGIGIAPLTVTSTTKVENLNADLLHGKNWAAPAALGNGTPAEVTASSLTSTGNAVIQGDLTLSGGDNALSFSAADSSIKIRDNDATALVVEEANNAYLTFDTTDSAEKVILHKNLDATDMVITAATFTGEISSLDAHDTGSLSEGANLYYTDERVDDRVNTLITDGQAIGTTYNDAANTLTIAVDTATTTDLGVASFATADFDVASGAVTIKASGVTNNQLAGSIENDKLVQSAMTIAGQSVSLGGAITAASIAASLEDESLPITALTELDAASAADKTVFATLNDAKTLTLGNSSGTIAIPGDLNLAGDMKADLNLVATKKYQIGGTDVLTSTTLGSGVVQSSLTAVGALAGGSIADGFGTISTTNNISTTKVIDLASNADAADFSADSTTGRLTLGASDALNLYHHTDSYIVNNTGSLKVDVPTSEDIQFSVQTTKEAHIDADGIDLASGNDYQINDVSVLSATTLGSSVVNSSLTSVGALNSGSITSDFTSINVGSGAISTSGTLTGGITSVEKLTVNNLVLDGTNIGHTSDLTLLTLADGLLTVDGEVSMTTLDIGGDNVTATAAELNLLDGSESSAGTTAVVDNHAVLMKQGTATNLTTVQTLAAYLDDEITSMPNLTTAVSLASVGTITSGTWSANTIAVNKGGTGATSLTDHGVLLGNGASAVTATSEGTDGQILIGQTGAAPAFADLGTSGGLTTTAGDNTLSLGLNLKDNSGVVEDSTTGLALDLSASAIAGTLAVADGGTGAASFTNGELLFGANTGAITTAAIGSASGVQAYSAVLDELATTPLAVAQEVAELADGHIEVLDRGQANGTAEANKAVVLGANKEIATLGSVTATTFTDGTASLSGGALTGVTTITGADISTGSINNTPIGGTTANSAKFTDVTATDDVIIGVDSNTAFWVGTDSEDFSSFAFLVDTKGDYTATVKGILKVHGALTSGDAESGLLKVEGSFGYDVDTTLEFSDGASQTIGLNSHLVRVDASGGAISLSLPAISSAEVGQEYIIIRIKDSAADGNLIVKPNSANKIYNDGSEVGTSGITLAQMKSLRVMTDGVSWFVI